MWQHIKLVEVAPSLKWPSCVHSDVRSYPATQHLTVHNNIKFPSFQVYWFVGHQANSQTFYLQTIAFTESEQWRQGIRHYTHKIPTQSEEHGDWGKKSIPSTPHLSLNCFNVHESPDDKELPFIWRWILLPTVLRKVFFDMRVMEDYLTTRACAHMDYTVVKASQLTNDPSKGKWKLL